MIYVVSGSRDYPNLKFVYDTIRSTVHKGDCVYHGVARGVDVTAGRAAKEMGVTVKEFPADWEKHGRAAGPIRNEAMLLAAINDDQPLKALIFWDGQSRGTAHMLSLCQKHSVDFELFTEDP